MKQIKYLVTLLCFFTLTFSIAQVPEGFSVLKDASTFKQNLKETSNRTQSISSDFRQEKNLTMMEEVLVSNGRFLFKKENKVKWEYVDPIVYAIIINQNQFTINNDGKISEFDTESNKLFKEINNMIVMAIQGNFVDDPEFKASFYQNNASYLAVLIPQNELLTNILTSIEIYFSKSDVAVTQVKFIEPGEDFTKITFINKKVNLEIDDNQFSVQ